MEQIFKIAEFIVGSFIHIWPYLAVTIPVAVFVRLSGASNYISRALGKKPVVAIVLATAVGALSPFCSCGVIPVIASLLIGGVPLAPVMSFWIASPSMDPEIFFLSTATIGWKLSVWRLVATFVISLLSGFITHLFVMKGWLGEKIMKENLSAAAKDSFTGAVKRVFARGKAYFVKKKVHRNVGVQIITNSSLGYNATVNCCVPVAGLGFQSVAKPGAQAKAVCNSKACASPVVSFKKRLVDETWKATLMVTKFMTLAFFVNALIQFYVPQHSVSSLLGGDGFVSVVIASFIGIPFYTSSITALPLVSGLIEMGMNEGAALAFLISGPITTLPAMAAVWGLVRRKIFLMYVSFAVVGSVVFGILINLL